MPGPWYNSTVDPDFYDNFDLSGRHYYELCVLDNQRRPQGTILILGRKLGSISSLGKWMTGDFLGASDPYYDWWMQYGKGRPPTVEGLFHFCKCPAGQCPAKPSSGQTAIHFCKVREVYEADLRRNEVRWMSTAEMVARLDLHFQGKEQNTLGRTVAPQEGDSGDAAMEWGSLDGELATDAEISAALAEVEKRMELPPRAVTLPKAKGSASSSLFRPAPAGCATCCTTCCRSSSSTETAFALRTWTVREPKETEDVG